MSEVFRVTFAQFLNGAFFSNLLGIAPSALAPSQIAAAAPQVTQAPITNPATVAPERAMTWAERDYQRALKQVAETHARDASQRAKREEYLRQADEARILEILPVPQGETREQHLKLLHECGVFGPEPGDTTEDFERRLSKGNALGLRKTQSDPPPRPANWIDPDEADARFRAQQLIDAVNANTQATQSILLHHH